MEKVLKLMEFNSVVKECFDFVNDLAKRKNENLKEEVFELFTHLIEECGEVARLLVREKNKPEDFSKEKLAEELADVFIFLATIAQLYNIDFESSILKKVEKLRTRFGLEKLE